MVCINLFEAKKGVHSNPLKLFLPMGLVTWAVVTINKYMQVDTLVESQHVVKMTD